MEKPTHWSICDISDFIHNALSEEKIEAPDCGIGLSWSNFWKLNLAEKYQYNRYKKLLVTVGLEVWFYPNETLDIFKGWFINEYIPYKKKELASAGKQSPVLPQTNYKAETKYAGKKAYFTGFYKDDKEIIKNIIVPQSGVISVESFGKTTDFLIMGPNRGPSKIKKAQEWGIPCLSVEVFVEEVVAE